MTSRQALAASLAVLGTLPVILVAFVVGAYAEMYGGSFGALAPAGAMAGVMLAVWLVACAQLARLPQRIVIAAVPAGIAAGVLLLGGAAAWGGSSHESGIPGDSVVGPVRAPTAHQQPATSDPISHPSAQTVRPAPARSRPQ